MRLKLRLVPCAARDRRLQLLIERGRTLSSLRWPHLTLAALLVAWGGLLAFQLRPVPSPWKEWMSPAFPAPELPKPWPQSVALEADRTVEARFPRGGTLAAALHDAGVPADVAAEVVDATSDAIDVRRIREGQPYELYFDDADRLLALRYPVDRQTAWFVAVEDDAWETSKVVVPVKIRPVFLSATISGSLEGALVPHARSRKDVHDLVQQIADIYGWDVDFNYDLQPGDRLDLVVEERWVEDEFIGYGDLLAAAFQVRGRVIPVVRFRDDDARVSYYTPGGESLRRTFLRSPVKYQRISSRFSLRRIHPVTGIARAHRGVDYVAYPGTPVQATADGVVVETAYSGEPGRYVKIRHGGSYSSIYMHLSRYAEGIRPGTAVTQGQVIGYVGKTGNATGYHLHYGLMQGDHYVDPLRLQFPAAEPVPREHWAEFTAQRDHWLGMLHDGQSRRDVQVAGAGGL